MRIPITINKHKLKKGAPPLYTITDGITHIMTLVPKYAKNVTFIRCSYISTYRILDSQFQLLKKGVLWYE